MHRVLPSLLSYRRGSSAFIRFPTSTTIIQRPHIFHLSGFSFSSLQKRNPAVHPLQAPDPSYCTESRAPPSLRLRDHWPFLHPDSARATPPRLQLLGASFLDPARPISERVKAAMLLTAAETALAMGLLATDALTQDFCKISPPLAALPVTIVYILCSYRSNPRLAFPFMQMTAVYAVLLPCGAWVVFIASALLMIEFFDLDCSPNPATEHMEGLAATDAAERSVRSGDGSVSIRCFNPTNLLTEAPMIVLFAPLHEELFFRVLLFARLASVSGLIPAYAISSLVFGACHVNTEHVAAPWREALLGGLLASVYHATGRVWPSMVMHMCQNSLALGVTAVAADVGLLWELLLGCGSARLALSKVFPEMCAIGDSSVVHAGELTPEARDASERWFDALFGADGTTDVEGYVLMETTLEAFQDLQHEEHADLVKNLFKSSSAREYHERCSYQEAVRVLVQGKNKQEYISAQTCIAAIGEDKYHSRKLKIRMALLGLGPDPNPDLALFRSIIQPIILSHDRGSGASTAFRAALISLTPQLMDIRHACIRTELVRRLSKDDRPDIIMSELAKVEVSGSDADKQVAAKLMHELFGAHPQLVLEEGQLKARPQPESVL